MMGFKFFHGYDDVEEVPPNDREEAFERLMTMLHEMDSEIAPNRNNYEINDDWDVTLSDGLGEE
jgi:hypothetical protein